MKQLGDAQLTDHCVSLWINENNCLAFLTTLFELYFLRRPSTNMFLMLVHGIVIHYFYWWLYGRLWPMLLKPKTYVVNYFWETFQFWIAFGKNQDCTPLLVCCWKRWLPGLILPVGGADMSANDCGDPEVNVQPGHCAPPCRGEAVRFCSGWSEWICHGAFSGPTG